MTHDEIIALARQVGVEATGDEYWPFFIEELEAFAKLVAEAEREACAKICEDLHPGLATRVAAEHIRARGQA